MILCGVTPRCYFISDPASDWNKKIIRNLTFKEMKEYSISLHSFLIPNGNQLRAADHYRNHPSLDLSQFLKIYGNDSIQNREKAKNGCFPKKEPSHHDKRSKMQKEKTSPNIDVLHKQPIQPFHFPFKQISIQYKSRHKRYRCEKKLHRL